MRRVRTGERVGSDEGDWAQTTSGNTVTFTAPGTVYENDRAEIRVQYPHDPAMAVPAWQANDDRMEAFKATAQPIGSLLRLVLARFVEAVGSLFWFFRCSEIG